MGDLQLCTLTFLGALQRGRVRVTVLLHQSVDLSIVQDSRDKALPAVLVDPKGPWADGTRCSAAFSLYCLSLMTVTRAIM